MEESVTMSINLFTLSLISLSSLVTSWPTATAFFSASAPQMIVSLSTLQYWMAKDRSELSMMVTKSPSSSLYFSKSSSSGSSTPLKTLCIMRTSSS